MEGHPKGFRAWRPDGKGGWTANVRGVRRVLYRLPETIDAIRAGRTVFIVEGEKDVESLVKLGLDATCNPFGGHWNDTYSDSLAGARVIIIPDNDDAGRNHAEAVAGSLAGKARDVRILELPGLAEKQDVSDWLSHGGSREELEKLVAISEKSADGPAGQVTLLLDDDACLTDAGNAERLIATYGREIRYCPESKSWLVWNGKVWAADRDGKVNQLAKATAKSILDEAFDAEGKPDQKVRLHGLNSLSSRAIKAMLDMAKSEPGIAVHTEDLDCQPWLLNCDNGTLDLRTGALLPHDRNHLLTKIVPVEYSSTAECPRWKAFLHVIMAGNQEM